MSKVSDWKPRPLTDAERYWGSPRSFGWYGVFHGAFKDADLFHKFSETDLEALAKVAAKTVLSTQDHECDAVFNLRQGIRLRCSDYMGHYGKHNDQSIDD